MTFKPIKGWIHDPLLTEFWVNDVQNKHPIFSLYSTKSKKISRISDDPILLYEPILKVDPNWIPPYQGEVGCCVGCGFGTAATILMAQQLLERQKYTQELNYDTVWHGEASFEAVYGGSRIEAKNYKRNYSGDGSTGAAACKWLTRFGVLTRQDYSQKTGIGVHDLRKPSPDKARNWGQYGVGGWRDWSKLDKIAKENPIENASLVLDYDDVVTSIENKRPVPICSNVGFQLERDTDGFAEEGEPWAHCMVIIGVRYDIPGALCLNSWDEIHHGYHYPLDMPRKIKGCSFWIRPETIDKMLKWRDSYSLSGLFQNNMTDPVSKVELTRKRFWQRFF